MEKHVTLTGALHISYGAFQILGALVASLLVAGGGLLGAQLSEEPWVLGITSFLGTWIVVWAILVSMPGIIGGGGLLRHKSWARYLVLAASLLILVNFPLGTGIGIYSFWVLVQEETAKLFGPCC